MRERHPHISQRDTHWRPNCGVEVLEFRARLLARIRAFFTEESYLEVETPLLSRETVVDAHIEPIKVDLPSHSDSMDSRFFLQTSPEFAMKRLLASGLGSIYQIAKAFRQGEIGALHNPEFTMIEWYRVGDDHHTQMNVTEQLIQAALEVADSPVTSNVFSRISYDDAFLRAMELSVKKTSNGELLRVCQQSKDCPESLREDDRDGILNFLLATHVEPTLGVDHPEFLYDYPASQAALAKVRHEDFPVAERFELYWNGVELANGYNELTDPEQLRQRIIDENQKREANGNLPLPAESRLLSAMEAGLPPCSGVALGFDRLAMCLLGRETVFEVMPFPSFRC